MKTAGWNGVPSLPGARRVSTYLADSTATVIGWNGNDSSPEPFDSGAYEREGDDIDLIGWPVQSRHFRSHTQAWSTRERQASLLPATRSATPTAASREAGRMTGSAYAGRVLTGGSAIPAAQLLGAWRALLGATVGASAHATWLRLPARSARHLGHAVDERSRWPSRRAPAVNRSPLTPEEHRPARRGASSDAPVHRPRTLRGYRHPVRHCWPAPPPRSATARRSTASVSPASPRPSTASPAGRPPARLRPGHPARWRPAAPGQPGPPPATGCGCGWAKAASPRASPKTEPPECGKAKPSPKPIEEMTFEAALAEMEELIRQLEEGQLALDEESWPSSSAASSWPPAAPAATSPPPSSRSSSSAAGADGGYSLSPFEDGEP